MATHNWPESRLGDLGEVFTGRTPPTERSSYFGEDFPFITPGDMHQGKYARETQRSLSFEGAELLKRIKLPANSVCVSCIGWQMGEAVMTDRPSFSNQQLNTIVPNSKVDAAFLYYSLRTRKQELLSLGAAAGVRTPILNKSAFCDTRVVVPPLAIQQRIAGILSAYDELIENSQRRIKNLESMARALYREWFVHFRFPGHESVPLITSPLGEVPQGWEVKSLNEIAENFDRMRKPLSKMQRSQIQGEYPYYGAAKIFDYINDYIFDGEYLLLGEDGSVITPERSPVLQLVNEKFWPNNHTHVLRGKPPFATHFLYLGLSEVDISPYITGAAQPKITQENMNRIPFFCGPEYLHLEFNRLVEPMIRQNQILKRQIQNLRRTRDLLLPRLLSGQINVEASAWI